ncbi:MAG: HEAT repeat domain-containing protein [Opitutaceae bacterium]|nr:HEAT repeat domain-containing protein [Opitutaceae bacterium]
MNCQRVREILPELIDESRHGPAGGDAAEARAHIAACPACEREFAALARTAAALDAMTTPPPSPRLRKNFYTMLAEEKLIAAAPAPARAAPAAAPARPAWWRAFLAPLAACALLAIGFLAGRQPSPGSRADDTAMRTELQQLREQVNKMGTLVSYSLLQQQQGPANDRLRGVLAAARAESPNDKTLDDLVSALAFDPSANVRLRALEALAPHAGRELVRSGVLAALPREQNPLVQLELIDFVAATEDPAAAPALERLSLDQATDRSVRDAAQRALARF